MRRYALGHGLQMVHLEVLTYLHRCNRYSNTTQALSDFLGQTKGSISQTVGFLEKESYLKRVQDHQDKRVFHLELNPKSRRLVQEFETQFYGELDSAAFSERSLEDLLVKIQRRNGLRGFGMCLTCRYNSKPSARKFVCGLTGENLTAEEVNLNCREHEALSS